MAGRALAVLIVAVLMPAAAWSQESTESHLGKGYDHLRQERYKEAVTEFEAALRLDPKLTMRARFPLAVALFELHQSADARREFEMVRHEAGDHPNVSYYLGRLDLQDQQYAGAVRNLTKALTQPPFPDTAYYLGLAYFKLYDLSKAEEYLKQASQINPRDSQAPYQLGQVYRRQGRETDAKKAFALSVELRERDTEESALRTECAQKLKEAPREEARAVCRKLYDPENAERLTMLGTVYGQHGDLEDALEALRRAAQLSPQSPQMQYNLAFTYYQMGRFAEARVPLEKAAERWPDLFPLHYLYGAVLLKLGDESGAYRALTRAHELNSQDPAAASLLFTATMSLAHERQEAHAHGDALRYFIEAVKLRPGDPEAQKGVDMNSGSLKP